VIASQTSFPPPPIHSSDLPSSDFLQKCLQNENDNWSSLNQPPPPLEHNGSIKDESMCSSTGLCVGSGGPRDAEWGGQGGGGWPGAQQAVQGRLLQRAPTPPGVGEQARHCGEEAAARDRLQGEMASILPGYQCESNSLTRSLAEQLASTWVDGLGSKINPSYLISLSWRSFWQTCIQKDATAIQNW